MKKVISILLATLMLTIAISGLSVSADVAQFAIENKTVQPGEQFTLYFDLVKNVEASSIGITDFNFGNLTFVKSTTRPKFVAGEVIIKGEYEEETDGTNFTSAIVTTGTDHLGDMAIKYNAKNTGFNAAFRAGHMAYLTLKAPETPGTIKITATPDLKAYTTDGEGNVTSNSVEQTLPVELIGGTITVVGDTNEYTVTYNANGGTTDATTATVEENNAADLTKTASKEGYTFLGWNTDKDATTALDSYTVTGDVTLYAIYEAIPATSLLEGIYTRLAKNVTIDYTNKTINLVYDTAQRVFQSSYVAFAPKAADGVTVTYSSKDAFISDHARLTNYTETASSATNIDLAAEKATSKSAIVGNAIQNAQGTYNFTMHLENVSGEVTEDYQVTVQLTDTSAEVVGLVANSGITAADFKTFRESDEVAIDTLNKVITLTTKNMYNYTTIAIDATKIGENAIATNAARPHRAMELINADDNARYMDFANIELANQYSSAVLVNYVNGETRSYPVRIYGGSDGTSYEDYTLTVVYAPTTNTNDIKIGRIHNLANAIGNSVAEINETGKIQITYDPAKSEISFSPVYARGYYPTISGDEGKVVTEQQTIAGALRDVYTITAANIPSALKYNVRRIRDTRVYDFEFLIK